MVPHLVCPLLESSQIGDARRQAARLAATLEFDEVAAGRLALVVTELATNLVRHARSGMLLIGTHRSAKGATAIELISMDHGPGMRDIEQSLVDGVSTGGTSGTGLGAVRRLSNQFLAHSRLGSGTVIVARVASDSNAPAFKHDGGPLSHAGLCIAAPAETISGDAWACASTARGASMLMADGLGHGPDAAAAAYAAVRVFEERAAESPRDIVERCHAVLRSTRGAAVAAIAIDTEERSVTFCGAGNISARLLTGIEDRTLMSQHGTVGLQIRKLQEIRYDLPQHAILVAHSDGIVTRWTLKETPELLSCDPVIIAAHLLRDQLRGKDDATVLVVRCD